MVHVLRHRYETSHSQTWTRFGLHLYSFIFSHNNDEYNHILDAQHSYITIIIILRIPATVLSYYVEQAIISHIVFPVSQGVAEWAMMIGHF